MSNNKPIDFDALQRQIDEKYEAQNRGSGDEGVSMPVAPLMGDIQQPEEELEEGHSHEIEVSGPYMILQFEHTPTENEGEFGITGFKLNLHEINPEPDQILTHLRMVIANIEEQVADGGMNFEPTEGDDEPAQG